MVKIKKRLINILRDLSLFSGSSIIAQLIMMVYVVLIARILGPEEYGFFASTYSLVGLTAFALNFGMDTWLLRKAGLYTKKVSELSGSILKIKGWIGIFWGVLVVTIPVILRPDLYRFPLLFVCMVDILCDVGFNTQIQAMTAERRMREISILLMISRGSRLIGLLVFYFLGLDSALIYAIGRASATFVGLVVATFAHKPIINNSPLSPKEVLFESAPFGFSEFLALIYANIDITLLALMVGVGAVGLYSPASGIIHALFVIPNAIFTAIVPIMTKSWSKSLQTFNNQTRILFFGFTLLGVLLWMVVFLSSKFVIDFLLGNRYEVSGDLLAILSPILLFKSLSFSCAVVLVAVGWQKRRLIPQVISAMSSVVGNIIIIPIWGLVGVSWVYVISEAILMTGYIFITVNWFIESKNPNNWSDQ